MDVDGYGVHQIDIFNETADSLWLTWRLVENTLPDQWEGNLCDNVLCYGVMPTSANMKSIAPDSAAFIRMTTYPNNFPGSGDLHFWIYKTGFPQDYVSMTFHLSAGVTGTTEKLVIPEGAAYPNPTTGLFFVDLPDKTLASWILYNSLGQIQEKENQQIAPLRLDFATHPPGLYWLQIRQKRNTTTIPVQRQ
ncbi:MAG: T9SS type A sorting domain-containing protein [Saprospirales bacterium]|nr:T9SS type A sorting domain-containing protein [Saprospirales bacterium]